MGIYGNVSAIETGNHGIRMDKLDNWLVGSVENGPLKHDKPWQMMAKEHLPGITHGFNGQIVSECIRNMDIYDQR